MKTSAVAVLATAATSASAYGTFSIINRCAVDLHLWSVTGGAPGVPSTSSKMFTLPANDPTIGYRETYQDISNGAAGVSIKVAPYYGPGNTVPPSPWHITQLEYTIPVKGSSVQSEHDVEDLVFYDMSWVNGDPTPKLPTTMQTSDPTSNETTACRSGSTAHGSPIGYLWDTDDRKTYSCKQDIDITWTFCDGNEVPVYTGPTGLISGNPTKREAEPESEADSMALCAPAAGGIVQLCDEPAPVPTPAPKPAPKPVAGLEALQVPANAVSTPAVTSSSSAPVATVPVVASSPNFVRPVELVALKYPAQSGVKTWLSFYPADATDPGAYSKREEPAQPHNHMAFHTKRRNRIVKSA